MIPPRIQREFIQGGSTVQTNEKFLDLSLALKFNLVLFWTTFVISVHYWTVVVIVRCR